MHFFKNISNEEYKVEKTFEKSFDIWQKNLFNLDLYVIILSFLLEVIFLIFYIITERISIPVNEYVFEYIIRPSTLNFVAYFIGKFLYRLESSTDEDKLALPLLLMIIISSNLIIAHYVFPPLYTILIAPIFISTIYACKRIEIRTFLFSLMGLIVSFIFIEKSVTIKPEDFYINIAISSILILLAHIVSQTIIENEEVKEKLLEDNYEKNNFLKEELLHDGLTKLYNHTALFNILESYMKSDLNKNSLYIAIIDIDFFKKVNDTFGHETGNIVLCEISKILRKLQNDKIFTARYGGEEFTIVFYDMNKEEVYEIVENLRKEIENLYFKETNGQKITISGGISAYKNGISASMFFDLADKALYEAKNTGRNKIIIN